MIDIAVNDASGLTVIHDDPVLDGALALDVERTSLAASLLLRDGRSLSIGKLKPSMLAVLPEGSLGRIVRMTTHRVARFDALLLRIND